MPIPSGGLRVPELQLHSQREGGEYRGAGRAAPGSAAGGGGGGVCFYLVFFFVVVFPVFCFKAHFHGIWGRFHDM